MNDLHNPLKEYSPPYVAVSRLQEALKLLSTRSFSQVTADEFITRKFSKPDAFQTVTALKFLNLITDDGSVTEKVTSLQLVGDNRIKGLQEIVKWGYSKLFGTTPDANNLSREELHNEFIAVYGISPRLAKTAVPAFIWLCKEAGLEVSVDAEFRQRKIQPRQNALKNSRIVQKKLSYSVARSPSEDYEIPFGNIKLIIPNTDKARVALLGGEFKEIADKLTELSNKLMKDEPLE